MTGRKMPAKLPILMALAGGLIAGGGGVALLDQNGPGGSAQMDEVIRTYILSHPEIIPEAMTRLRERETTKLLADNRKALEMPFSGAWAGGAKANLTLVMFTDYSCGYCRASVAELDRLLAEDKGLKVVWREIPVLGPGSEAAAHAALAAAGQNRYLAFHRQMFASGPPDANSIAKVLAATGVVLSDSTAIDQEIDNNLVLAQTLGLSGTPAFIVGNKLMQGAVGYDALKDAIAEARKSPA